MSVPLAGMAFAVLSVILSLVMLAVSARREAIPGGDTAYWDEDCACCGAGCGPVDDVNACLVCGH